MSTFDIATFGSSLTAGNASPGGMWQASLARSLAPGKASDIRVYNCGGGGWDSSDGVAVVAKVIRYRPRLVTIEFLMNDCNPARGISFGTSAGLTAQIIDAIRAALPDTLIYLMTMNPALASETNRAALPVYNDVYRSVSVTKSVGLIDVYPLWGTPNATQIPDGVHPTLAANKSILVPKMVQVLSPLIA